MVDPGLSSDNSQPEFGKPLPHKESEALQPDIKIPHFSLVIEPGDFHSIPRKVEEFLGKMAGCVFKHVQFDSTTRDFLARTQLIEIESPNRPEHCRKHHLYFEQDRQLHEEIWTCNERMALLTVRSILSWPITDPEFLERAAAVDLDNAPAPEEIHRQLQRAMTELDIRSDTTVSTPQGDHIRLSSAGNQLAAYISTLSREVSDLAISILLKTKLIHYADSPFSYSNWIEQLSKLSSQGSPLRHFRKLYLAVIDGSVSDNPSMNQFLHDASIDQAIVNYLGGDWTAQSDAASFLRSQQGGRFGPPPFRRSQEGYERTLDESGKIATRARAEAGSFTQLAWETKRLPDGGDSLFLRFGKDVFSTVQGIYTTDQNTPPGGGFVFDSPRLEQLFFLDAQANGLETFKKKNKEWLGPAVDLFEDTIFVYTRGAKIVINNSPAFRFDKVQYAYVVFNDHQNSSYIAAMAIPLSIIGKTLKPSVFELDVGPSEKTISASSSGFNARNLRQLAIQLSQWPIDPAGISSIFSGPGFGLPPRSSPHFTWENEHLSTLWHDCAGHIHCSYRIWNFREMTEVVDETLKPLQELNETVGNMILGYQQLLDLFNNRYLAWKNDQTPGVQSAPRMLTECYRMHRFYADSDQAPILFRVPRIKGTEAPVPLIDCKSMELFHDGKTFQLPRHSDGSENAEISLWNRYVRPYLRINISQSPSSEVVNFREGNYELCLMGRENLQ